MALVDVVDGQVPRAPKEGTYVAPSGHRAWFPEGAPLLGGYVAAPDDDASGKQVRNRETGTQRRKAETAD